VPWGWDSTVEGNKSFTDSGKKYKPVGVNCITPLSLDVGDADLEFPLFSLGNFLPTNFSILIITFYKYLKILLTRTRKRR
jgi:hypothetical protein